MMRRSILNLGLWLACAVAPALGDYWVQYQPLPDAPWPEDQGWERITAYGGAQRSIEDGALVLDSSASGGIVDFYRVSTVGLFYAEPGHPFVFEWLAMVDYATGVTEASIGLFSDDHWGVGFAMTSDRLYSVYEYPLSVPFVPGWHAFRIITTDMRFYSLSIDGIPVLEGAFIPTYSASRVSWGDGGQGAVGLSRWAYAGFGVVPEPRSPLPVSMGLVLLTRMVRGRRAGSLTFGGAS